VPTTILDIFDDAAFNAVSLTDNVNIVPNTYGLLQQLGLFNDEPIPTTSVAIEIQNGVLNLLPSRQRGAPPSFGTPEKRHLKSFVIPHFPHDDSVLATDVQNMLAWVRGLQAMQLETVLGYTNRKLIGMRRKHAITLENLRMGAVKGVVLDADGSVIVNFFTEFGVTPPQFDFTFGAPAVNGAPFNIGSVATAVTGYMEDNLMGDTMTGVLALCSPSFFRRFVSHPSVVNAYQFYAATQNPNRDDVRRGFTFQDITWREYRGYATYLGEDKTTTKSSFVPDGDARFIPLGTTETFANYWAPPDFMSAVNEAGEMPDIMSQVFVAPLEPKRFGKGIDIHTESNPLPVCKRPALLVRGFSSN